MNRTGQLFAQQLREKQAKDAAETADVHEVRRQARLEGWEAGFTAGWDALAAHLVAEGILAPDEPEGAE
jgi:hypothetical protein